MDNESKFQKQLKFIEMRANGYSYDAISKEINVSKPTLINWNEKYRYKIKFCRESILNDLYHKYSINQVSYVTELGETLRKINKEIESLDFSNTKADKLIELKLKCIELLRKEFSDFKESSIVAKDLDVL